MRALDALPYDVLPWERAVEDPLGPLGRVGLRRDPPPRIRRLCFVLESRAERVIE